MAFDFDGSTHLRSDWKPWDTWGDTTVAMWIRPHSSQDANVFSHFAGGGYYSLLGILSDGTARARWRGADTRNVVSSNTYTANAWTHLVGQWGVSRVRAVFLNGTKTTTGAGYSSGAEPTRWSWGAYDSGSSPFDGDMLWPAVWNVQLSDEEVASLYAGASPLMVRPDDLAYFAPWGALDEERITDLIGGTTIPLLSGTETYSDSSPAGLIYPSQQIIGVSQGIITPPPQYNQRQILLKNRMSIQNSRLLIGK